MRFVPKLFCGIAALALCLAAGGCLPSSSNPLDEQREPHFLTGKSRVNSMDYEGAVEAFEKALEVNPHSASAHFELGLLYENNEQDFAAAIYHFDRFLKLRPNSEYAFLMTTNDTVKDLSPAYERHYAIGFRTKGPVGHSDQVKRLAPYVDFGRSYPAPDGNLIGAKPLYFEDPQLRLFFTETYVERFFTDWKKLGADLPHQRRCRVQSEPAGSAGQGQFREGRRS